jgi:prevent-host-death family protein
MMKNVLISEDIFPIGEFKKHASRLFRRVHDEGRPVIVTQNGSPVGVVVPPEEYDRLAEQSRLLEAVQAGLSDLQSGRVFSENAAKTRLEKRFGSLEP